MFIREVGIKNYKSLEDVKVPRMNNLVALVGANSAGKTCVLEVLRNLPSLHFGRFEPLQQLVTRQETNRIIEVNLSFEIKDPERMRYFNELQRFGFSEGLEKTNFFKRLKITFMTRPDGVTFEGVFCPVFVAISDENGEWMPMVETDIASAANARESVLRDNKFSKVLNVGRLRTDWFEKRPEHRLSPLDNQPLNILQGPLRETFYYDVFLQHLAKVRFLDSKFVPPDSMGIAGTLSLASDSNNLPSVFHSLHSGEEERFQELVYFAKQLIPEIDTVRTPIEGTQTGPRFSLKGLNLLLSQLGSGIGRALAIAYQALMTPSDGLCVIEEPESHLHPAAQRVLLRFLTEQVWNKQIIFSTHSPAMAGSVEAESLYLVKMEEGATRISSATENGIAFEIARALGVNPSDQITTDSLVVFVDGSSDEGVLRAFASSLSAAGKLSSDVNRSPVAILPLNGEGNLNFLVDTQNLWNLRKVFWVILDSDRKFADEELSEKKKELKSRAEGMGGKVWVWKKRELENYLHPDAIARVLRIERPTVDDYCDVKAVITAVLRKEKAIEAFFLPDKHGVKIAQRMSADEILQASRYTSDGADKYEIVELFEAILENLQELKRTGASVSSVRAEKKGVAAGTGDPATER